MVMRGASNCIIYIFNKRSHDLDDNIFILDRKLRTEDLGIEW